MVAKSVVKLTDEAILPAIALIVGKTFGLFLAIFFLKLPYVVQSQSLLGFLPTIHFQDSQGYITAENYSNLAMFFTASVGTLMVIIRAHFFHISHIHPHLHSKLVKFNLASLVATSYNLYHQATIWLAFLWLSTAFLLVSSLSGITYPQITFIAFLVAANFSWIIALDVQKEVEIANDRQ